MTRRARAQAAEAAITREEIAQVIAGPDVEVAIAEDPGLRCVGRGGLYAVVDPGSRTVVTVAVQPTRTSRPAPSAELDVLIRRRPVADRPHRDVPTALLAAPPAPVAPTRRDVGPKPGPVRRPVSADGGAVAPRKPAPLPPTTPVGPGQVVTAPPAPATRPHRSAPPGPDPVLPSVLSGTLTPRPRTTHPPAPRGRTRPAPPPAKDKLAGVHPGIAAGVRAELARRGLDESRVVVHSPTNVEIR